MHVVVLMGGWSSERAVSLASGEKVAAALLGLGHRVTRIDLDRDVAVRLAEAQPDVVFNALHGTPGEDGAVQGLMDLMGLRYTHSDVAASAIAIDKTLTKRVLEADGIQMPFGKIVRSEDLLDADPLARPFVVKPIKEGSSVGVVIVTDETGPIVRGSPGPWTDYPKVLVETYIPGHELTVGVLGDRALLVTELKPHKGFYDYDAKYTDGATEHICPAQVPKDITDACLQLAMRAHRLIGCRATSRTDFRWDDSRGVDGLFLLEVNTQPGMTELSLLPEQAKKSGISYPQLVQTLVEEAATRDVT